MLDEAQSGRPPAPEILAGKGIHSGRPCRLEIRLGSPSDRAGNAVPYPGPRFSFPGLPGALSITGLAALPREARRATLLGMGQGMGPNPGEGEAQGNLRATVETPEHLFAALLFFPGASLAIRADAAELPGLDGSALPYREALARLLPAVAAVPAWREYPCGISWTHQWQGGELEIRPADRFRATYSLERGSLREVFTLDHPAVAWNEILPARTFAFHREWREGVAAGLMAGADRDSGLLLAESETEYREVLSRHPEWQGGPYPLLNQPAWRMPLEPVKHKLLDLLGDLALAGLALPRAEIRIRNGGHHAHHLLLARLLANHGDPGDPAAQATRADY